MLFHFSPTLHTVVAINCVELGKNLLTASYISDEIRDLRPAIENKKLLFLCEMGLDPGIDHMSAMKIIDEIHEKGGRFLLLNRIAAAWLPRK